LDQYQDGYTSDDLDMSDASGAHLESYLDMNSLHNYEMEMDDSSASSTPFDFFHADGFAPGNGSGNGQPPIPEFLEPSLDNPAHFQPAATGFVNIPALQLLDFDPSTIPDDGPVPAWLEAPHPVGLTNPNPLTLGPSNYGLIDFLRHWARDGRDDRPGFARDRSSLPWPNRVNALSNSQDITQVRYADLEGDQCDFQGVDWEDLGVRRKEARERRLLTYNNYVNRQGSDRWTPYLPDRPLPRTASYFRFRRMDMRRNIKLSHFQLRNVLASTSRTRAFYPSDDETVHQFNPVSGKGQPIMQLSGAPSSQVSTLAAGHGTLVAGCFNGEYIIRHIDSGEPERTACHYGVITSDVSSGITNHAQIYTPRMSSSPVAAFASNDHSFRVLDIATEKWLSKEVYGFPLNCTAVSPDGRLRVMVGDHLNVFITTAESTRPGGKPEVLQSLSGHRDFGFACDWADDGWTVATGFQDKAIKIWDARRWTDSSGRALPVCTLRAEMAGVRNLRFSPIGSGKRVLVAAEEADFINIIDAQSFRSKQTVDVFSEIGGVSFANDGQDLMVLCCDRFRGGLMQLERCGVEKDGGEMMWSSDEEDSDSSMDEAYSSRWLRGKRADRADRSETNDWPRSLFTEARRVKHANSERRRKGAVIGTLEPF